MGSWTSEAASFVSSQPIIWFEKESQSSSKTIKTFFSNSHQGVLNVSNLLFLQFKIVLTLIRY